MSIAGAALEKPAGGAQFGLGIVRDPALMDETGFKSAAVSFPDSELDYTDPQLIDEVWEPVWCYWCHILRFKYNPNFNVPI